MEMVRDGNRDIQQVLDVFQIVKDDKQFGERLIGKYLVSVSDGRVSVKTETFARDRFFRGIGPAPFGGHAFKNLVFGEIHDEVPPFDGEIFIKDVKRPDDVRNYVIDPFTADEFAAVAGYLVSSLSCDTLRYLRTSIPNVFHLRMKNGSNVLVSIEWDSTRRICNFLVQAGGMWLSGGEYRLFFFFRHPKKRRPRQ
ncbi:MAG: hypothetical protein AAB935_00545 [Patescibacteria group bacterium]